MGKRAAIKGEHGHGTCEQLLKWLGQVGAVLSWARRWKAPRAIRGFRFLFHPMRCCCQCHCLLLQQQQGLRSTCRCCGCGCGDCHCCATFPAVPNDAAATHAAVVAVVAAAAAFAVGAAVAAAVPAANALLQQWLLLLLLLPLLPLPPKYVLLLILEFVPLVPLTLFAPLLPPFMLMNNVFGTVFFNCLADLLLFLVMRQV